MCISDWSSDVCSSDLPLEQACAQLFAHVLRDSLGGTRDASDVLIPNVDLSQLWPDQLESYLAQGNAAASSLKRGHAVRQLACTPTQVDVDGMPFDAAVLAANAPGSHKQIGRAHV